ncbi:type II toxin-antitoxin system RelE/ParE family toxin [uncultured Devosia sp.]|uniref:type II toxin-antitoxin system RelE/ParE family toxin n=1 Tax=uncultured Devosia sp. TaxID=211434 RepID=UPI0035CA9704
MPHLKYSAEALAAVRRFHSFLAPKNPRAAKRAGETIRDHLRLLRLTPDIGRPIEDTSLRELIIPYSDGGYIALYQHDIAADTVFVLAIRHQKEAGY